MLLPLLLHFLILFSSYAHSHHLRHREWEKTDSCPSNVVAHIDYPSSSRRNVRMVPWWDDDDFDYMDDSSSSNPQFIQGPQLAQFNELESVYSALVSCPNIASLHLHISHHGCIWDDRDKWEFDFRKGDRFPPLKELHTTGYRYDADKWEKTYGRLSMLAGWSYSTLPYFLTSICSSSLIRQTPLRWLLPCPIMTSRPNIDQWMQAMDWSQLETLSLARPELILLDRLNRTSLPSLKHLELRSLRWKMYNGSVSHDTVRKTIALLENFMNPSPSYLPSYPAPPRSRSLETLKLVHSWEPSHITQILHSPPYESLKHLELRQFESDSTAPRSTLNTTVLSYLRQSAPNLRSLSLDVHRNGSWPYSVLNELSKFRSLESLELRFELASDCLRPYLWNIWRAPPDCLPTFHYRQPRLDQTSATEVFKYIRDHKEGSKLVNLTLVGGDWGRDWGGGLRLNSWLETRAIRYRCSVVELSSRDESVSDIDCIEEKERPGLFGLDL